MPRCCIASARGEATKVDIGMLDCQIALLENAVMRYTVLGEIPGPLGARHPTITPFQALATKDGSIIIAAGNDGLFQKLCAALGRKDLAESALYRSNDLRLNNQPKLQDELERTLREKTDRGLDPDPRGGRHSLRPDQQRRPGARPSAGRGAQHGGHGRGQGGRHAQALRQSAQILAFADPPTRDPAPDLDGDRAAILKELGM